MKIATNLALNQPLEAYPEAIRQLEEWRRQEPETVDPEAGMRWLVHGQKTTRSIVAPGNFISWEKNFMGAATMY